MELKNVFKANDIRGIYRQILDDNLAYEIGRAVAGLLKCKKIVVGRDMRISSPALFKALSNGLVESGVDVVDLGLTDTPQIYYATCYYNLPGVMITASHNPANYNGIKIVNKMARPIDSRAGLKKIAKIIERKYFKSSKRMGNVKRINFIPIYKKFVLSLVDKSKIKKLKIVIDAGNGMAGKIVPLIYNNLNVSFTPLYFNLDGRFPNHIPNPIIKSNLKNLSKKVRSEKADLGMAFDGDMDRIVFIDERGISINPSHLGALLAKHLLECCKNKNNDRVIYSSAASRIIKEIVSKYHGKPIREKVGHAFIKKRMKNIDALFGIEHSGHYYYRNNFYADSGLITSLLILEIYSEAKKKGMKFSDLIKEFEIYSQADEASVKMKHDKNILKEIEKYYESKKPKKIDHFDGLTIEFDDYWFSVRKSNTEPLLRVNLESINKNTTRIKLKEIKKIINENNN